MLYGCKDKAHGQPCVIYENKGLETAWREEPGLKGESQPAGGSAAVGLK